MDMYPLCLEVTEFVGPGWSADVAAMPSMDVVVAGCMVAAVAVVGAVVDVVTVGVAVVVVGAGVSVVVAGVTVVVVSARASEGAAGTT